MHPSVRNWVQRVVEAHSLADRSVLEVGGLNVNGSVRDLFRGPYLSTDMRPGPGVDRVVDAHDLSSGWSGPGVDVVVCCEMLEHDLLPWVSVREMARVCAPRGWLLLTCRGFDERGAWPLHAYPVDAWRFSRVGLEYLAHHCGWRDVESYPDPEGPGVFLVARNGEGPPLACPACGEPLKETSQIDQGGQRIAVHGSPWFRCSNGHFWHEGTIKI